MATRKCASRPRAANARTRSDLHIESGDLAISRSVDLKSRISGSQDLKSLDRSISTRSPHHHITRSLIASPYRRTLHTNELTKSYSGRTVVRGVSLDVSSGEVVGLLGPNGAGKTTTFYMTVGLTAPDSGRVMLDGDDVTDDPMYVRARKGIGYLPQEPSIFRGLTVEQNILAILETLDLTRRRTARTRLRELLAELNLTPLAQAPAYTLSGGERRRAEITRALVMSPRSCCSTSRSPASIRSR